MTILDKILKEKETEIKQYFNQTFEPIDYDSTISLKEKVQSSHSMCIISEIKRSSPSKGNIKMEVNPVQQAKQYEASGASAISVLTDPAFFNGTMEDLREVRKAVNLPILCKDFIIDSIQIDRAKAAGANIILLIVAALDDTNLEKLYHYAKNLDLEILVEVHNEEEMERALKLNPEIIGINNRNLKTFDVNIATTEKLASMVTNPDTILISESGMKTQQDVIRARDAGAKVILVGETLMLADDIDEAFRELKVPLLLKGAK
ncbi:indole-3-glycerol phosphate synthase TrpC [Oceanobacillus caeni]|uniref:indole-3-glycerol phosphate synthase TrpC n=1 Tax=Oceanobacillus TaxID=182709 RepID=UPI000621DD89|nr:indole-3-glycerol phosphate synthase TrpC [Oceanobacillus caeni]KKE78813.1 indole-3-glycerol phosphate synthase [Bacilli bacterium VT-13-104]PZD85112.1 indole-3-glycerol phosphate synthase TrpC [Bacilli bacterium]MBU8791220.1 indole-3-glycerol phosphate synthase TrpC [Oceanobacillus caeni]MCR1834870.1 indole-3-glycerol phosphate synthase TrpC [Oceanobacillus caeni]PZD86693.1 indole-3-glycerol phosphate synthase TrpC [Bacilli bacterium]